jgi:MFS family permease
MLSDRNILFATACTRSLATGMIGVMLGIYLARLHFTSGEIGGVIGAGLAGAALAALMVTIAGDRMGRRRTLFWLAMLSALGGLGAALAHGAAAMTSVAFLGMLNGMGRDRGASLVLE